MNDGDDIAAFYDAHPYPPPTDRLEAISQSWRDGTRRRVEHARLWPTLPYREDQRILVAGCGTSQAARLAVQYPRARVVGIDVSGASLSATARLAEDHGLGNVELHQLPVEEVGELGQAFDHVVCTGVLHHLPDPVAGLRELTRAMTGDAALHLMVYATYGRLGIAMFQEYCRRLGVDTSPGEIQLLVTTLRELPEAHPLARVLRESPDFGDDDALADALLNPRERTYTVPELFRLLDDAGARFVRWVRQAPYRPQCGSMSEVPHGRRIEGMADADQFAAMELFRGTIVRHSAVAYRTDSDLPASPVLWDGEAWRSYVPMVPTTVVDVEDRLPRGTALALVNRAHVDRDLVCFLDAQERRAFEAVDGRTPLREIPEATSALFERLWLHDLVMIDASDSRWWEAAARD